jgi:phosphoribosylaminoimidazole-succinocarboxamide synthase
MPPMVDSGIAGVPCRKGKVRDVYDLGDRLVIVATDRISAFDWVLPTPIPDKGRVLTGLTLFWLDHLQVPNHLLSIDPADFGPAFADRRDDLVGRSMLVKKTEVVPFECVVRGYLAGSGWKEYRKRGSVSAVPLPLGMKESEKFHQPIFTPATKAETGHDENVSFEVMSQAVGRKTAEELRSRSLGLYRRGAAHAASRGIILADTKYEWGRLPTGELILIDEVMTPDSSRFWPADQYQIGTSPPSYDKQFVRDWLETTGWDKASPPPALPDDVVAKTAAKYRECYERITGKNFV